MNIFFLHESPIDSALAQHDRHVVKMILESAQMLSTACWHDARFMSALEDCTQPNRPALDNPTSGNANLYKATHVNHPCNLWARRSPANFVWLAIHMNALLAEYHRRFPGKTHGCYKMGLLFAEMSVKLAGLPHPTKEHRGTLGFWTDVEGKIQINPTLVTWAVTQSSIPPFCGPEQYLETIGIYGVIEAYRRYYLAEKVQGNRWTNPIFRPAWLTAYMTIHTSSLPGKRAIARPASEPKTTPSSRPLPLFLQATAN